jgi:negative regulator of flagellin synthesis FlgM
MRISGEQSQLAASVAPVSSVSPASSAEIAASAVSGAESPAATVSLSPQAQEIQRVRQTVAALPETRDELVASLKAKVDSGTYNVSSSDIAEMILRRNTADQAT